MHLSNLVQRTKKNLNTGVFTQLNPGTSPMMQTGIGLSSSVKYRQKDNDSLERAVGTGSGLTLFAHDKHSTSN